MADRSNDANDHILYAYYEIMMFIFNYDHRGYRESSTYYSDYSILFIFKTTYQHLSIVESASPYNSVKVSLKSPKKKSPQGIPQKNIENPVLFGLLGIFLRIGAASHVARHAVDAPLLRAGLLFVHGELVGLELQGFAWHRGQGYGFTMDLPWIYQIN